MAAPGLQNGEIRSHGLGIRTEERLKRLGTARESSMRLSRKSAEAEAVLGIHGVSVTAGHETREHSVASRDDIEAEFRVHNTPTRGDPLHRTIELAKPVTSDVAERFNRLFGRS